jgi:hypothetical protein
LGQSFGAVGDTSNLPSGYVKIVIEHGPIEKVDLPSYKTVMFHIVFGCFWYVYQRVTNFNGEKIDDEKWDLRVLQKPKGSSKRREGDS